MPTATQDLRQRRATVVREHIEAENAHDLDRLIASFKRPAYDVAALGVTHDGEPAVRDLIGGIIRGFPDFRFHPQVWHHADDALIVLGHFTGTHRAEWAGIPATGRPIDIRCSCVFDFEGDGCVGEQVYFDFATILRQLGVPGS